MKKTESQSRINSINIVKIESEPIISDEFSLIATIGLLDSKGGPNLLGRSIYRGPWSPKILKLVNELRDEMESNLLHVYFEEINDTTRRDTTKLDSIIEPKLGTSEADTPQL